VNEPDGRALDRAIRETGLSTEELWLRYVALGGTALASEIDDYRHGQTVPDPAQHDVLAHALNERFAELGGDHPVPYSSD
jgi:hypothetical protein